MTNQLIKPQFLKNGTIIDIYGVYSDKVAMVVDEGYTHETLITLSKSELDLLIKNLKISRNQLVLGGN